MKKQVLFINGGGTHDSYAEYLTFLKKAKVNLDRYRRKKWSDFLQRDLGSKFDVVAPKMPNQTNAQYEEWSILFKKVAPLLQNNVILVGHSLGALFLAKYLSEHKFPKKISATFLVATPYDSEGMEESLGNFTLPKNLKKLAKQGGKIFLYQGDDDPAIPFSHLKKYEKALPRATAKGFKNRGHFTQPKFPELIKDIKSI